MTNIKPVAPEIALDVVKAHLGTPDAKRQTRKVYTVIDCPPKVRKAIEGAAK